MGGSKRNILARFVPRHQYFLDEITMVYLKLSVKKCSLKSYAEEFQAKMVSCKRMNEYVKLVYFYSSFEEATRHKYFERESIPETLGKALALADQLMVESSSSRIRYESCKVKGF